MSSTELQRLYSRNDRGLSEAKGMLTRLHRKILIDLRLDAARVTADLERWLSDPSSNIPQTPKHRTQARGNYIKKMIEPSMSWRSFMDMMQMLYPKKIRFRIEFDWPHGQPNSVHILEMDLSRRVAPQSFTRATPSPDGDDDSDGVDEVPSVIIDYVPPPER